jgi:hypothetical protein
MTADVGGPGVPRFDVVLRGYDRRQVDEHVARLQRVMSRMRADLEVARSQPIPVVRQNQGGFGGPGRPPAGAPRPAPRPRPDQPDMIGSFTDRMQSILQAAEEEAAEIRNKARAAAQAEAGSVRAELADVVRQRDAARAELARLRGQIGELAGQTTRVPVAPREGAPQQPPGGPERPHPAPKPRPQPGDRLPGGPAVAAGPAPRAGSPPPGGGQAPAAKAGAQQPGDQRPGSQQPGSQRPGSQHQGGPPASPPLGSPAPSSQPGSPKAGSQQPAPATSGGPQPGAQRPGAQQPGSQQPGSTKPGSPPPGAQQPGTHEPGGQQPGTHKSGAQQPGAQQAAGPQQPAAQRPAEQPLTQKPGSSPSGSKPPASPPAPAKPQAPPAPKAATPGNGGSNGAQQASKSGGPAPSGGLFDPAGWAQAGSGALESRPAGTPLGKDEPGEAKPGRPAAHRLPTGAYPAVADKNSSTPPDGGSDQEPGALVGTPDAAEAGPGDVQATVKVSAVGPPPASDATVMSPQVPPADKKDGKPDAAGKAADSGRASSPSRSG